MGSQVVQTSRRAVRAQNPGSKLARQEFLPLPTSPPHPHCWNFLARLRSSVRPPATLEAFPHSYLRPACAFFLSIYS